MDGGVVSLEGFGADTSQVSDSKSRGFGSGFLKQERSDLGEEQWRTSKVLKVEGDFSVSKSTPLHHGTPLARSERILSFSSLKPEVTFLSKDGAGYGLLSGSRGPFTPSQWIELEHQALIYKYLLANVPVPSNLLIPLKRSFNPYGLSGSSAGSLHPNSLGWGSFHLGFSGNTDPEIGRCRRTDGKKWRCSRDAVADQKYCEKHMNRGRHRSRKPVEGQNGHAAPSSGPTNAKMVSIASSPSASVISNGGGSNVLSLGHTQFKNLLPGATNPSADALVNRLQDPRGLSMTSSTTTVTLPNQEIPFEDSTQMEFGLVPSNSLLNRSQAGSYMSSKSYSSFLSFADTETHNDQHPVHQFVDNWPKDQLNHSIISWPEDLKSDWTQLSMSIPMASDISSSASSPADDLVGPIRKHAWGASLGGPLGEVLTNTSMGSSPTGVLQKSSFGSQSNSSSGSSPIAQSRKTHESLSLYDDTLCPSAANSLSIPTL